MEQSIQMFKIIKLLLLMGILISLTGCGNGINKLKGKDNLTENQKKIITGIQQDGFILNIECPIAYVSSSGWENNSYLIKEQAAKILALYCQQESFFTYNFNTYSNNNRLTLWLSNLFTEANPDWIILKDDVTNTKLLECLNNNCKTY